MGGVTTDRAYFSYGNIPFPSKFPNRVPHNVGSVIDGRNLWGQKTPPNTFITEDNLIPIGDLEKLIKIRVHDKDTFIYRALDFTEKMKVFDVPDWIKSTAVLKHLPNPLKAPQFVISNLLQGFGSPEAIKRAERLPPLEDIKINPNGVWLNELQCFLPHAWIPEGLISEKAAKCDDLRVLVELWDRRILLVLKWGTPAAIETLRATSNVIILYS